MADPVSLYPLATGTPAFARAEALYLSAFPECERRPVEEWRKLAETAGSGFRIHEIRTGNAPAGFISCWTFPRFVYVEHFAINPGGRGRGTGGKALEAFKARHTGSPLVLEVEHPETEEARRRIAFYTHHGFSLLPLPYLQPPYRPGGSWLPLHLMSTDEGFASENFEAIRQTIYREVYHAQG